MRVIPKWEDDKTMLYLGDCEDVLLFLQEDYIDLIITSPPYDNLRDYDGSSFNFDRVSKQIYRVMKPGGVLVWVVGDATHNGSETGTSFRQVLQFMSYGLNLHDTMIYEKNGPSCPSKNKYYQVFEYMFVLSKGKPNTFNPIKDRKNRWYGQKWSKGRTRRDKAGNLTWQNWHKEEGEQYGTRFNIWRYNVGAGYSAEEDYAYEHPAIFPEELARDHILSWSNPGDIVMDPLMGSGTTGKMAVKLDRHFVGVERVPAYYEIAEKRIRNAGMQLRMKL